MIMPVAVLTEDRFDPMAMAQPDWLRHDLLVSGPGSDVAAFQAQAAGSGAIPWHLPDLSFAEEDRLHALLNPPDGSRGLSLVAARILARQLRSATESHADRVILASRTSQACPFDLHALLPVPATILHLGPDHAASQAWLRRHWGILQSLRQVRRVTGVAPHSRKRAVTIAYEFWSADWTPWQALVALRRLWPSLVFDCRPDYAHG